MIDAEPFDLLIADTALTDGSATGIVDYLKANKASMKSIALSGSGAEDDVRRLHQSGFDSYIVTPTDVETLLTTIGAVMNLDAK